ncbi:MAG: hypothetical protein ABJC13_01110 [Acidobacteriota bacterium]
MRLIFSLLLPVALLAACTSPAPTHSGASAMDDTARAYVRLVLAVGVHDGNYVDAYYGPPKVRTEVEAEKLPLIEIRTRAERLRAGLAGISSAQDDPLIDLRHAYLEHQLGSLIAHVEQLEGKKRTFDEESLALYDAVAPKQTEKDFDPVLAELERTVPGTGPLGDRIQAFRDRFTIPADKLDAVFQAAIHECRARTLAHLPLPPNESFEVEYVKGKPWSAYNWYKGDLHSLIQVNTELPILIDRAIDLACHEGYPGHHVYNALLEQTLVRDRGWAEFTVYPLFSPQSLIAEGTANYGIEVAFPGTERTAFERDVLYPIAGLDPKETEHYTEILHLVGKLDYAGNTAARRYLDGETDAPQTVKWLERYALSSNARSKQRVSFFDTYRSYVINYNLGRDLVRTYVEGKSGGDPEKRWQVFGELISSPRLPSGLR